MAVLNFDQAGFGSTGQRCVEPDDLRERGVRPGLRAGPHRSRRPARVPRAFRDQQEPRRNGLLRLQRRQALPRRQASRGDHVHERLGQSGRAAADRRNARESWRDRDRVEMDYDVHYHSAGDTPENTTDKEPRTWAGAPAWAALLLRWLDVLAAAPATKSLGSS